MAAGCSRAPTLPPGTRSPVISNWTLLSSGTAAKEDTSLRVTLTTLSLSETVEAHQKEVTSVAAPYIMAIILLSGYTPQMALSFQAMSSGGQRIRA